MTNPIVEKVEQAVEQQVLSGAKLAAVGLLNQLYTSFTSGLISIKGHPNLITNAVKEFDSGYLWFKEAILTHNEETPVSESVPAPEDNVEAPSSPPPKITKAAKK